MKMIITRFNYKKYKTTILDIFVKAFMSVNEYYDADMLGSIISDIKDGKDVEEHFKHTFMPDVIMLCHIYNITMFNKYFIFNKLRDEFISKIYDIKP